MKELSHSNYGERAQIYGTARKGFPKLVFDYLLQRATSGKRALDVGCGTGIASRQMFDRGFQVTATDIDERLINQARRDSLSYQINYFAEPARKQHFERQSFDVVTAFSAMHWMSDDATMAEIKRLLVSHGLLFVVNKYDTRLKSMVTKALKPFMRDAEDYVDEKSDYDPVALLKNHAFHHIEDYEAPVVEEYSLPRALMFVQSMSIWSLIAAEMRNEALDACRVALLANMEGDHLARPLTIRVVSGYNATMRSEIS